MTQTNIKEYANKTCTPRGYQLLSTGQGHSLIVNNGPAN